MEKEKKGFKVKRITFILIIVIIAFLAGNVFAALSGNNNLFFAIRDLFVEAEVEGKDELLVDRDETNLVGKDIENEKDDEETEVDNLEEKNNIEYNKEENDNALSIDDKLEKEYGEVKYRRETEASSGFFIKDGALYSGEVNIEETQSKVTGINGEVKYVVPLDKQVNKTIALTKNNELYINIEENGLYGNSFEKILTDYEIIEILEISGEDEFKFLTLDEKVVNLDGKVDFEFTTDVEDEKENKIEDEVFTNEEIKTSLLNYQELVAAYSGSIEGFLVKLDLMDFGDYTKVDADNYVKTDIKFEDYKKACLEYVTEDCFIETTFFSKYCKNVDGYLSYYNVGATGYDVVIESVKHKTGNKYSGVLHTVNIDGSKNESYETEFSVKEYNGKCVIDSCDK